MRNPNDRFNDRPEYPEMDYDQYMPDQQEWERDDLFREYGSIIKDLTDTTDMLKRFELRLLGYGENLKGEIVPIRQPMMEPELVSEFMDMIRSIVNQNTHFSKYDGKNVEALLERAAYEIPAWMMDKGNACPRKKRGAINFMAFNLIYGSLFKANEGTILRWTKGSFRDGTMGRPQDTNRKRGLFSKFMFWK